MSYKNKIGLILFLTASFGALSDPSYWQQVLIGSLWIGGLILFFGEDKAEAE